MPIQPKRAVSTAAKSNNLAVAPLMWVHHSSGSCSAQPCRGDWMASSAGGEVAEAITVPVSASSKHALMLELPMSYPKKSISIKPLNLYLIRNLGKFKLLAYDLLTSTHRMLIPLTYSCFL